MKKILKRALCGIFVLVFMLANANIALAGNNIIFSSELIEPELYYTASNGSFDNLEKYIGDIDEFQKYILDNIMTDESNLTDKNYRGYIDLSKYNIPYSEAMFAELADLINNESPELFRIKAAGISYYLGGNIIALTPTYTFSDPAYFRDQYDVFVDVTEKMLSGIKGNSNLNEVEKALLLHDRLIEYCEYDYESYLAGSVPDSSHSAYGALCLGTAVCQGYAYAYDYLLEQVGIEAEYCSSNALNHAWNIVYIDNKPYHVDVTSDDPVWDVSGRVNHNNFLRSTEGIKSVGNHNAADYIATPVDTTYDNYFWQNSTTAFQLVDNKIYYIDNEKQELNVIDDITDTSPETIAELDYTWTTADGRYYNGNYSRLASIRGEIFYSAPTTVYSYNPTTDKTETVISNEDILDSTGTNSYRVYGMTAVGCTLWGEYSETPNYDSETKRNQIFTKDFHNPTENWNVVKEPTFSNQGKEENSCIDCGEIVGSRLIPALSEHNFGEWYIDPNNKPTCTEKGVKKRDCQDVGCDVFEWDYADELGHNYSDEYTIDLEPTCVETGIKSCHCTRCDARTDVTEIPATGIHIEGDAWIKGKDATCEEDGYLYKACKGCGKEMSTQVLLKGECSDFSVTGYKEATCFVDGYSGDKTCRDCGTFYKGETIKATGHKEVVIPAVAPTFTTVGKTEGKKCSVCGTITVAQKDVAKLTLATPVATVKNSGTGVKVTWNAIDGAESYKVYRKTYSTKTKKYGSWKGCATVKTTSYVDTKAKSGTKYIYTVKALNGDAKSGIKSSSSILYLAQPTVKIANASTGVKVTWNKITGATGYKIYRAEYANGKWTGWKSMKTISKGSTVSWTDKSAKSGVKYKYTVKAVNGKTASTYKSSSSLLFLAQPKTTVKAVSNGVKVSWTQITGATSYKIYRSEYNTKTKKWSSWKGIKTAKSTSKSYTDKSAKKGVKYRYTVKAVNGKVASSYKASSSVKR